MGDSEVKAPWPSAIAQGHALSALIRAYRSVAAGQRTLSFSFVDLDLIGGNDPMGFTVTTKVYGSGGALSPTITMLGQSGPLAFNVSGDSTSQPITLSDVRSVLSGDPCYVNLVFGANMTTQGQWTNTLESMAAALTTTTVTPEPSSLLLFGSGLAGAAAWRFGRRKSR